MLARKLLNEGKKTVLFDNFAKPMLRGGGSRGIDEFVDKVTVVRGDILDPIQLLRAVQEHHVEFIVHLAAHTPPETEMNPTKCVNINCIGSLNVFEVARLTGVKRVVWASTAGVVGSDEFYKNQLVDEDMPVDPMRVYAASKAWVEFLGRYYREMMGLDNIGIRVQGTYGGVGRGGSLAFRDKFLETVSLGKPAKVEYGDQVLHFLYADDIANVWYVACQAPKPKHCIFNIGAYPHTVREFADYVKKLLPEVPIEVLPGKITYEKSVYGTRRPYHTSNVDLTNIKKELRWEPRVTMEEGVRETINAIRKQNGLPPV